MFFSFLAVFPLPESYQNDPKFHFNTLLRSDTQKSSKNVENTTVFWSRCETVFGPPPPAKADIATAILTNVIEHLVLLFCPPISTPSPPKRCGRIFWVVLWPGGRLESGQNLPGATSSALRNRMSLTWTFIPIKKPPIFFNVWFFWPLALSAFIKQIDAVILRLGLWSQNILVFPNWVGTRPIARRWPSGAAEGQVLCASAHTDLACAEINYTQSWVVLV